MNKKIIPVTLGLAVVLTACGNKNDENNNNMNLNDKIENAVVSENIQGEKINFEDIKITPEDTAKIFREKLPEVKLKDISLDNEKGSYLYKVSGQTEEAEYEIIIDPVTGEVLKEFSEKDREFVDGFEILNEDLAKINPLVEKALENAGEGYSLYEWDIEVDDGRKELNIELKDTSGKDLEYKYDVETEKLLEKDN